MLCLLIRFHAINLNFKSAFASTQRVADLDATVKKMYHLLSLEDIDEFEKQWKEFSSSNDNLPCFQRVYDLKNKLANCYTCRSMTLGCESTQRSENQNHVCSIIINACLKSK